MNFGSINMENCIRWILTNFSLSMFILAIIFIFFHWIFRRSHQTGAEIVFRWMSFFALGFTGIYTFIIHAFYPDMAAEAIGWQTSPFQFEVAIADLAIGVLGVLAYGASFGFRAATVVASTIFLWGAAFGHFYQIYLNKNYSAGNAGSWLWMDIVIPLILIICILKLKPHQY